jgi:peroxiredoxin (alkyl hydroperoxide reductase subunit C)
MDFYRPDTDLKKVKSFCAQTTDAAPLFTAEAYDNVEKRIKKISLESYRGKWVVLFFYGSNFTFV